MSAVWHIEDNGEPVYVVQELWGDQWLFSSDFCHTLEEAWEAAEDIRDGYDDPSPGVDCVLRVVNFRAMTHK